jgi:hypothetical protein
MSSSRNLAPAWLGVCVLVSGCFTKEELEDAPFDPMTDVPYRTLEGPVSTNGLSPVDFWAADRQQALRALGASALLDEGGTLVATPLLDTPAGRSVLSYALRCALGGGTTVQSAPGATFTGDLALAPAWTARALTTSEQRWVTACLLDHLNGLGSHVSIMLQGNHPALIVDPNDDPASYSIDEMTGFGNMFLSTPKAYVCVDPSLDLSCGANTSLSVLQRICGSSPTCGATNLGLCTLVCSKDAAGNPTCAAPLGATYPESISTKLQRSVAVSLYPLCVF